MLHSKISAKYLIGFQIPQGSQHSLALFYFNPNTVIQIQRKGLYKAPIDALRKAVEKLKYSDE